MHAALGLLLLVGLLRTAEAVEVPSEEQDGKIVNGTIAGLAEFPYAVSILPRFISRTVACLFFYISLSTPFAASLIHSCRYDGRRVDTTRVAPLC